MRKKAPKLPRGLEGEELSVFPAPMPPQRAKARKSPPPLHAIPPPLTTAAPSSRMTAARKEEATTRTTRRGLRLAPAER